MNYLKGGLSAIAAVTLVLLGPSVVMAIRYPEKATGLAVLTAELLSPVFWLLVLFLFGLFWIAGRLANKFLRILLFWIPAASISAIGCIVLTFILYVIFRFHRA
jgi:hypothetical protein